MIPKSINNNRFISPVINSYIQKNIELFYQESNDTITIFTSKKENNLDNAIRIYERISGLAKPQKDKIKCYLFLIDIPKEIDVSKDNITSAECNTASTTFYFSENYIEVALWRREEWRKVFYHELIHAFSIDTKISPEVSQEIKLKVLFPHYNNSIREAYTEILATLFSKETDNKDECIYLGSQVNKIIYFLESTPEERVQLKQNYKTDVSDKNGLEKIDHFFKRPANLLDPSTNTSSYYFLKSIYFWYGCYKEAKILEIDNLLDKKYINSTFYKVILEALESGEYISWLQSIYFKPTNTSMRLTYNSL